MIDINLDIKQYSRQTLDDLYNLASNEQEINLKLNLYQLFASSSWRNYSGSFSNKLFEEDLIDISNEIIDATLDLDVKEDHVLHVMTEAYHVGGHTRVVENWIKSTSEKHSVIFNNPSSELPDFLLEAVKSKNGEIILNEGHDFIAKANFLARIASKYKFIVLHHHPDDILPLLAFGTDKFKRVILLYNHADHTWGCGYSVSDMILEISKKGMEHSVKYRGVPYERTKFVGIPIDLNVYNSKISKQIGQKSIVSMASAYKFKAIKGLSFQKFVDKLLEKEDNAIYHVIGVSENDKDWRALRKKYQSRLCLHGVLSRERALEVLADANLYINSFPVGSATSFIEAMGLGIPSISYVSSTQWLEVYKGRSYADIDDMLNECLRLLNPCEEEKDILIKNQIADLNEWHSFASFTKRISYICSLLKGHSKIILTNNIIFDDYIKAYTDFMFEARNQKKFFLTGKSLELLNSAQKKDIDVLLENNKLAQLGTLTTRDLLTYYVKKMIMRSMVLIKFFLRKILPNKIVKLLQFFLHN